MGDLGAAVLNVIAIIALVAVGAFIIVFLSDLLISIIDGKNGIFFKRSKVGAKVKDLELEDDLEDTKLIEKKAEPVEPKQVEKLGDEVDLALAEEERQAILKATEKTDELEERVANLENRNNEEEVPMHITKLEPDEELSDEELDRMYAELIADMNREANEEEANEEVEETEKESEEVQEPVEEPVEEVKEDEEEVEVEQDTQADDKINELEKEIEKLKELVENQEREKLALEKQLEEKPQVKVVEVPTAVNGEQLDTIESLTEQRAQLEERLAVANKELKTNKKEYVPLARIQKSLERDEAKLRRREAVVAKKKIMLFGVTNYVVDPEKEQELAEELDQLEALRLSVQHCKEVMEENKDRYPLLESANKILRKSVDDLKADIETVDAKLEALRAKQGK